MLKRRGFVVYCSRVRVSLTVSGFLVQFFTDAPEINAVPDVKNKTYNFRGCTTWYDIGLQVLNQSGWRPDCSRMNAVNIERTLPPRPREGAPLIVFPDGVVGRRLPPPERDIGPS